MENTHLVKRKPKGSYKKYLRDASSPIPKTSQWRYNKHNGRPMENFPLSTTSSSLLRRAASSNAKHPTSHYRYQNSSSCDIPTTCSTLYTNESNDTDTEESCEAANTSELITGLTCDQLSPCNNSDDTDVTLNYDPGRVSDSDCSFDSDDLDFEVSSNQNQESDDEEMNLEDSMLEPIYENANITLCGAYCAIMEFKRACHLPFTTIAMLLQLLQLLCPKENILPTSVYLFKKFFKKYSSNFQRRRFCRSCEIELKEHQKQCENTTCSKSEPNTLISFDPRKAIKRVLMRNQNKLISSVDDSVICDVHTGRGYKALPSNTSGIIFNTDGVSPFKSSRITMWPLMFTLANLHPSVRMNKDNIITMALWVGDTKPTWEHLFHSFIKKFGQLSKTGMKVKTLNGNQIFKFQPLFGVFDLVAKAPVLNMTQFNGKNGCPACLHPGSWMHGSRYYLPGDSYEIRTNDSIVNASEKAVNQQKAVDGIKGVSVLTGTIDLVKSVPIDYMHCVLEGVTKWLIEKWFNSSSHGCPYYIGRQLEAIDLELLCQCPPHDFSRAPRSISKHRHHWKANEFRNWLLYYSLPVLVSILPPLYFHHYSLLVCAIHILLQEELTECRIQVAENLLKDFYEFLPELYGPTSCTLNAHLLVHLTMYVRLWGPLWTHSLFGFESMNGHIINAVHSKHKLAEQLSYSIDMCHVLGSLADRLFEVESEHTLQFISPLSKHSFIRKNMALLSPEIYSIGSAQSTCVTQDELTALQQFGFTGESILTFKRIYIHDTILYSSLYNDEGKRDSSVCCYEVEKRKYYGIIRKFCVSPPVALITPFQVTNSSLLKRSGNPCRPVLKSYADVDLIGAFIVEVANIILPVCAIPFTSLLSKCVKISCKNSNHLYVTKIPNNYEHH